MENILWREKNRISEIAQIADYVHTPKLLFKMAKEEQLHESKKARHILSVNMVLQGKVFCQNLKEIMFIQNLIKYNWKVFFPRDFPGGITSIQISFFII